MRNIRDIYLLLILRLNPNMPANEVQYFTATVQHNYGKKDVPSHLPVRVRTYGFPTVQSSLIRWRINKKFSVLVVGSLLPQQLACEASTKRAFWDYTTKTIQNKTRKLVLPLIIDVSRDIDTRDCQAT